MAFRYPFRRQISGMARQAGSLVPLVLGGLLLSCLSVPLPAHALSEIQRQNPPAAGESDETAPYLIPLPGEEEQASPEDDTPVSPAPSGTEAPAPNIERPDIDPDEPLPEVLYDLDRLPEPVRRMHELIVEACRSGDVEKLRPLLGTGDDGTQISLGGLEGDPIDFLRELSGDDEGQEILAILLEVLEAGFVHLNQGDPSEIYVWPYFFALPLDKLDARQRVELFTLVTAGDYQDMKTFGAYIFYRVGITPEGRWLFFVAGD
ncbi:hypothetical protein L598_003500000120 [Mesorhizobium sp. J18]|nr:hypothetical protein L598_003500000120 [Mesorhizobium sp. J18]